jgi:hypothetical protein
VPLRLGQSPIDIGIVGIEHQRRLEARERGLPILVVETFSSSAADS